MNSSASIADVAAPEHQFGRLNVIGTFVALQLCQLTQPYGSLLFRGHGGFFWRCNPLASFTEACLIFWHLGVATFQSRGKSRSHILESLRQISASLLLLRGIGGKPQPDEFLERFLAEGLLDGEASTATASHEMQQLSGASPTNTAQLVENPTHTSSSLTLDPSHTNPARTKVLHGAFGANALAHKELRIDVFTAVTEFMIFLKLIAVRGNGWFTAAGMFLVSGWTAVQILLVLFHQQVMNEIDMLNAIGTTKTLRKQLQEQNKKWLTFFAVLHLPFFGYPAYLAAFRPWFTTSTEGFLGFLHDQGDALSQSFVLVGGLLTLIAPCLIMPHTSALDHIHGRWLCLLIIISIVYHTWLLTAAMSASQQACVRRAIHDHDPSFRNCIGNATSFFEPETALYYIVDQGYVKFCNSVWLLVFLIILSAIYAFFTFPTQADGRPGFRSTLVQRARRSSLGNAIFVLIVFVIYLIWYDASKTYKPAWIDILG